MKKGYLAVIIMATALFMIGCSRGQIMDGDGMINEYTYSQISQDEAKKMMAEDGVIIVDVRRADEFAEGHIPDAINIANESIDGSPPEELPDKEQKILIYCRSGRRSKEAAEKLAAMGYTNIYEFGGIIDWTGDIVKDENKDSGKAILSFDSFDGGGPEFNVILDDESIVSYESKKEYTNADHEDLDGAGYTVTFSFTGKVKGETEMTIEERSPIGDNFDHKYKVSVAEDLSVTIDEIEESDEIE